MAHLRLFGPAAEAAGTRHDTVDEPTVGAALQAATTRYGQAFAAIAAASQVWVNGEQASPSTPLGDGDELAVLPPVSGG